MQSRGAQHLREVTGTYGLEITIRAALDILTRFEIPHLIAGGVAVQEHGYFRVTTDVDIIVPDPGEAVDTLTAPLDTFFEALPRVFDTVRDKRNDVLINFLPAGGTLKANCRVPFPNPKSPSDAPVFVTLEELIALKLDSWSGSPNHRHKDKSDVIELIKTLKLPRDLGVCEAVRDLYLETWDALANEPE
jgi:hypothetical protein